MGCSGFHLDSASLVPSVATSCDKMSSSHRFRLQVPTLSEKGVKGAYSLEIHSDHAVEVGKAMLVAQ